MIRPGRPGERPVQALPHWQAPRLAAAMTTLGPPEEGAAPAAE